MTNLGNRLVPSLLAREIGDRSGNLQYSIAATGAEFPELSRLTEQRPRA